MSYLRKRVYLAGPYTKGDVAQNVRAVIDAADKLANAGYAVYTPHLNHFWHYLHPHEWEFWILHDLEWLSACDYFVRLDGDSVGADIEEVKAGEMGVQKKSLAELVGEGA